MLFFILLGAVAGIILGIYFYVLIQKWDTVFPRKPEIRVDIFDRRPETGEWFLEIENLKGAAHNFEFTIDNKEVFVKPPLSLPTSVEVEITTKSGQKVKEKELPEMYNPEELRYCISALRMRQKIAFKFYSHKDPGNDALLDEALTKGSFRIFWSYRNHKREETRTYKIFRTSNMLRTW